MKNKRRLNIGFDKKEDTIIIDNNKYDADYFRLFGDGNNDTLASFDIKGNHISINGNENTSSDLKRCWKCGKWLPKEKFGKNSYKADGTQDECKECRRKM